MSGENWILPSLQNRSGGGTVLVVAANDPAAEPDPEGPGVATFGGSVDPIGIVAKRLSLRPTIFS
jgi:hypothetical protein